MIPVFRGVAALGALLALTAAAPGTDPRNPTCPAAPNWSSFPAMKLTKAKRDGLVVLSAEGRIDDDLMARLQPILDADKKLAIDSPNKIAEIWLRSPGGNAEVGNAAGLAIRKAGILTRIPAGWACFSACNFMFMGGTPRVVDAGGTFMVHMFTFTADGGVLADEVTQGYDAAVAGIARVERDAALLASQDNDFLIRAGVSRKLLTEIMYKQQAVAGKGSADQSTRRCLTAAELRKYNVTNAD